MGYLHIENLHRAQEILAFKTCYALEKIHGSSANILWKDGQLKFHSGGEKHERFVGLFNCDALIAKFSERFIEGNSVSVFGEVYGGKMQGMSKTYGKDLRFVVFDVQVGESWLAVPQAFEFVTFLGLQFVDFAEISTDIEAINAERDKPSTQAIRNGIGEVRLREGVVLRPPFEVLLNNGKRVIAKHKREEFAERGSPKIDCLDPTRRVLMEDADAIATEWVTAMRILHVVDTLISERENKVPEIRDTGEFIKLMVEDVTREAEGEIVDNTHVRKAIGAKAAKMFRQYLESQLKEL